MLVSITKIRSSNLQHTAHMLDRVMLESLGETTEIGPIVGKVYGDKNFIVEEDSSESYE